MDITEYEEFYKWYKANERRFHTSQMTEVEIAYSSYLHGIKQAGIKPDILQAEASAGAEGAAVGQRSVGTVAEAVDIYRSKEDMQLEINRLRMERDLYKERGGSAKGQP